MKEESVYNIIDDCGVSSSWAEFSGERFPLGTLRKMTETAITMLRRKKNNYFGENAKGRYNFKGNFSDRKVDKTRQNLDSTKSPRPRTDRSVEQLNSGWGADRAPRDWLDNRQTNKTGYKISGV